MFNLNQKAEEIAPKLLGVNLIRKNSEKEIKAKIIEVEAYCGEKDLACHAAKGRRTKRTEVMYQEAGTIYVYLSYGIHNIVNLVVSEREDPEAIMIRGIEIQNENYQNQKIIGPGRITKALEIDRELNNKKLGQDSGLYIENGQKIEKTKIKKYPRVGVDSAGPIWSQKLLRFKIEE